MTCEGICLRVRKELMMVNGSTLTADRYISNVQQDYVVIFTC